jgi:hypothetical protein
MSRYQNLSGVPKVENVDHEQDLETIILMPTQYH